MKKLFRESIKKLAKVSNENLSISFDHGSEILLGKKNQAKLYRANRKINEAIFILNHIE